MTNPQRILAAVELGRTYSIGTQEVKAVQNVNLEINTGQFVAIVGRSGSGKTTLLNLIAGLDQPTSGKVLFEEQDMAEMNERELTEIRRNKVGFVFQSFGLLPLLSAFENVELPLRISGVKAKEREERSWESLDIVGLIARAKHRPYELSGGEQQRVAIARVLVQDPKIIVADEPVSSLDPARAEGVVRILVGAAREADKALVASIHWTQLAQRHFDRLVGLRDGLVQFDSPADRVSEKQLAGLYELTE